MRSLFNLLNYGSRRVRYRFFGGIESRFLGQTRRVNSKFTGSLDFKRIGAVTSLGFLMVYTVSDHREQKEILKNAKQVSIEEAKRILELDGLNLNERHEMGWTCLHVQVANHNISAVKFLLTLGADPNISYEFRNTGNGSVDEKPPHEMLCQDNKLCKSLVKVINFKGFTSLHFAVLIGNLEMVTILLEAGADPSKKSEQGFTPSCLTNDPKILKLLEKYHTINEEEDKDNNNADQKRIIEKVSDSKEAGNELEHEIHESDDQNEDQMQEQSLEDPVLKNETMDIQSEQFKEKENDFPSQDTQTSNELNVILVQEKRTTELDDVQKQRINDEVTQEPEDQRQKVDNCEQAETPKIKTVNEPSEEEKMEPLSGEITKDVLRQDVKQVQKANESQVHDCTDEQRNLVSRKHDGEVKTESTNEETFSGRSVELVEIVEDQKSKSNELDGVETFSIQSEEIQENRNVITYVEMAIELSSDQKTETKDAKEEDILEGLFGNAEEVRNLKVLQDTQTSNELNVILVQEKRTTELDDVQKQRINDEVTQEPEDQRQKVDNCEQAETPKIKTLNEPSEEEKMEPLSGEITKDVLRQDVKQVQKANESQVHDCTDEQRNLVSRKHDGEVKTESTNEETFSGRSVELVEIVEDQKSKSNELDGVETFSIQSEEIQENRNVITYVEMAIELSSDQKTETKDAKEEDILEGLFGNAEEVRNLKVLQDTQTSNELNVILVQEKRTTELDDVQKQRINDEVTQEPEDQRQKVDNCEQAETPKIKTLNEPSEEEKMEPLSGEITKDVLRQDVKQVQKANESQVHDCTDEQRNLVSRKHDDALKTELANDKTFSDKSDVIKCEQVEIEDEEAIVKLVEIVEEQKSENNELDGIEILSIQSEEIQENGNVITDIEGTIALSPEQKMETIELEVKEEVILEGLTFENGIQSLEHTLNIVEKAQVFDEFKVILVQDQRTSDLGKVQLLINDKDVTQESQDQKVINCEQAETPKMETVNETVLCHYYQSEGEKMEPLHEEITEIKGDVPSQEVKQEQKAKESQVHDITDEQGNLLSGKPDGEVKTESTIEETFSDKSDAIKCDQVEKQGEEASIKLVEIFEEQIPKLNELNVSKEELIFDGKPKVNEVEQENGGEINHELESIANIDVTVETEIFDVISKVDKLEAEPIKQELNTDCHEEAIKIQMEDVLKIEPDDDLTAEVQSSTSLIIANFLIWASVAIIRSLT